MSEVNGLNGAQGVPGDGPKAKAVENEPKVVADGSGNTTDNVTNQNAIGIILSGNVGDIDDGKPFQLPELSAGQAALTVANNLPTKAGVANLYKAIAI